MSTQLPIPAIGQETTWVRKHLGHLAAEPPAQIQPSSTIAGGQTAADEALARFQVDGYASQRNEVWPTDRRGASRLSPFIRHGLLTLPRLWRHVAEGPPRDKAKFRDELLWQEYARHLYARLGTRTGTPLRFAQAHAAAQSQTSEPWDRQMACVDLAVTELQTDGWLVNQTRMWLASQWSVRSGWDWRAGEDLFFTHLLDGSRAANRLGWQWTVGTGTGRPYGFSRYQVNKRAPGLCDSCPLRHGCPIEDWPEAESGPAMPPNHLFSSDPDPERTAGPREPVTERPPTHVWLTAESLGADDPAASGNPDLPLVFVFDEPLLHQLRLSGKRLIFLAEAMSEWADRRELELHLGTPDRVLADRDVAVTYAPVPGFARRAQQIRPAQTHPYPWLHRPRSGRLTSFTAWRKAVTGSGRGAGSSPGSRTRGRRRR